jgi:hypothetical protein
LQALVLVKENVIVLLEGRTVFCVVDQRLEALQRLFAIGYLRQVIECQLILRVNPCLGFRCVIIFQPVIWIGNRGAEVSVNMFYVLCNRVRQRSSSCCTRRVLGGRAAAPKLVNNQGLTRGVVNDGKKALTVTFAQGDVDGNLFGNVERMFCGAA